MKKLYVIILVFVLSAFSCYTYSQNLVWAKQIGGTGTDQGRNITVDGSGNVYTIGQFVGTVDFDPGPGTFNVVGQGFFSDIFLSKLDASGNFVWAKRFGGMNDDYGWSVAVDPVGNVYLTGGFHDIADFDPGPGVFNLIAPGSPDDMFICKLDSNGNFIWAKQAGSTLFDGGMSIAVDGNGNGYTTGYFSLTVDFDPGQGVFNYTVYGPTFDNDIFILKLDSSGNFVWVKQLGGTNSERAFKILLDASGNIYTAGNFSSTTADFDPGPANYNLTCSGVSDIFISKLDSAGNFVWAKKMGGTASDYGHSVAVDAFGNVFTTGFFNGTSDFDPGTGTFNLTSAGMDDIFISKLDPSGNFSWAKRIGSTLNDYGYSVALDSVANVYTTGCFRDITDFDPGPGIHNLTVVGGSDIFVSKLDSSGNFIWADGFGSTGYELGYSLAVDANANIYSTGYFLGTADFDPGLGIYNMICNGGDDVFILKLSGFSTGIIGNNNLPGEINIYPNPASGTVTIDFDLPKPGKVILEVFDLTGRYVSTIAHDVFVEDGNEVTWDASTINQGIYFIKMKADSYSEVKRISVIK